MLTFQTVLNRNKIMKIFLMSSILLGLQGCMTGNQPEEKDDESQMKPEPVKVLTTSMEFQTVDTIASGWQTFHYKNESYENHFFLLDKYPEGKTIEDGEKEVIPVFQSAMDLISKGNDEEGLEEFSKLPEWFSEVVFTGGTGIISPGKTAVTTLKLEPGYYVMECYIKMANGMFHSSMGMVKELIVSEDTVMTSPPEPDVRINVSKTSGITFKDQINKGKQTFSVRFIEQATYKNFVGHDVHLVKLEEGADLDMLEMYMNWLNPEGLMTPAPDGFVFLGGVNDLPAGHTGYFTADLEPGKYALVSEVPEPSKKGQFKTFEVRN